MNDKTFTKPEKPFLLIFKDVVGRNNYEWFDDENEFKERIREVKSNPYPCSDIEAIEIGSSREIDCDELDDLKKVINKESTEKYHCSLCGTYIEEDNISVCNRCASEYKF